MKKIYIYSIILFSFSSKILAQVGINTTAPESTLDVRSKNHLGAVTATDGVLVPRVNSLAVSGSINGQLVYLIADAGAFTKGFHYWNGTAWTPLAGGAAAGDQTVDAWVNDSSNNMVKLGTQSDGSSARAAGADFVAKDNGAVGIGTSSPNISALLDVTASNKGILLPRVALNSITDQVTVPSPATGLIVFNTGTGALTGKGFVYWNGTEWRNFNNTTAINPSISTLTCSSATASPSTFVNGTPYNGFMTVPYTGGNGGSYDIGTSFTQNGLTFTQQAGTLNLGSGNVTYSISGTPNFSSPSTISVPISFLGNSCTASIGAVDTYKIGETRGFSVAVPASTFLINTSSNWMTGKGNAAGTANLGTTNGRSMIEAAGLNSSSPGVIVVRGLRLDFLNEGTGSNVRPVIYNTTSSVVRYHTSALSTNDKVTDGVSVYVNPAYFGQYMDGNSDFLCVNNSTSEYTSVQLTFDDGQWYVLNFHATQVDNVYHGYWVVTRIN
ncbi:hypothetical protein [Chryseobacterium viscerum]|uniref:C1q domain-containing protein n=1 Tax=Chryseobacterium viscerum TaxID=1037377 RepID=A0A5N4BMK7_9FLAO|nr:hypothetical protein [Chryseobacterium viscerum]KAB1229651.1 hypothetical protein F8D52_17280 [Chryseobacterium viscerum]